MFGSWTTLLVDALPASGAEVGVIFIKTRLNPHKGKPVLAAATNIFKTPETLTYLENYWICKYQYGHPWKTWCSACGTLFHSAFAWPSIPSWTWKTWPGYLGESTSFSQGSSPFRPILLTVSGASTLRPNASTWYLIYGKVNPLQFLSDQASFCSTWAAMT